MNLFARFSLVLAGCLAMVVYGPILFGQCGQCGSCPGAAQCPPGTVMAAGETNASPLSATVPVPDPNKPRPKMIDLGAGACIPCKKMKILVDSIS